MTPLPPQEPTPLADVPLPNVESSVFLRRMHVATYAVLLLVLLIYLLEKFRDILQPLFVAMFLGFLMHPLHRWLVQRGIPSVLAYGVILFLVALGAIAVGSIAYSNISQVGVNLQGYSDRLEKMIRTTVHRYVEELPFQVPELEGHFLREIRIAPDQLVRGLGAALGRFGDFTSWAALTLIYLLFLIAEQVSFPKRLKLAFGEVQGRRILSVVESIGQAISKYIAVKTFASALGGLLSYAVLALFGVDFAATWGILIFVLNYIPYLGSLIAVAMPIVLSFVQFDEPWIGLAITILLIGIQQVIGSLVEPRLAGQRLDVSPLLILLSLAFWGVVWGVIGMILAVPLLVVVKIILDNIPETKPIATLISNR